MKGNGMKLLINAICLLLCANALTANAQSTRTQVIRLADDIADKAGDTSISDAKLRETLLHLRKAENALNGGTGAQVATMNFLCNWKGDLTIKVFSEVTGNQDTKTVKIGDEERCQQQLPVLKEHRTSIRSNVKQLATCDWRGYQSLFIVRSSGAIEPRGTTRFDRYQECLFSAEDINIQ